MRKVINFLYNLGINLLLNLWGIIPAAILLILHFALGISVKWAVAAFVLWVLCITLRLIIITFFVSLPKPSKEEEYRPNKNPYSKRK